MVQVGIVGTGFVARGAYRILQKTEGVEVSKVLTRRGIDEVEGIDRETLTNSISELIDSSDLIFDACGDAIYATEVLLDASQAGLPIVTMNSEFHVTTGSYFVDKGYITEADGDQPGCLARLGLEAKVMGFRPLAYMNVKGFLNTNPSLADMEHWARVQHLRIDQVVSFTDGSKLQIEQALVANGLDADIVRDGMLGKVVADARDVGDLGDLAEQNGRPISDYILSSASPPGVFLIAQNEEMGLHDEYGPYAKLRTSNGRYSVLMKPYHLIHLEIPRTIIEVLRGEPPLLNNSAAPRVGVASIAKRPLERGLGIQRGLGGFDVRGEAVNIADHPNHVPLCLLNKAVMRRDVAPDQQVTFDDVELPESRALEIYLELRDRALVDPNAGLPESAVATKTA